MTDGHIDQFVETWVRICDVLLRLGRIEKEHHNLMMQALNQWAEEQREIERKPLQ
jgi:hypothetical protein